MFHIMLFYLSLLSLRLTSAFHFTNPYNVQLNPDPECRIKWPDCHHHDFINTICLYPHCGSRGSSCKELPPDAEFRRAMLEVHNKLRNKVASGEERRNGLVSAADMKVLSYDLGLEYTALCHVNGCSLEPDKCRRTPRFLSVGQNVAKAYSSRNARKGDTFSQLIEKEWYEAEIARENFTDVISNYTLNLEAIHFTALIWADVAYVGCARAIMEHNASVSVVFLTCNYGPAPNWIGGKIYEEGPPCSKCPRNVKCNKFYGALCGEIEIIDTNIGQNPYYETYHLYQYDFDNNSVAEKIAFGYVTYVVLIMIYYFNFY